MDLITERVHDDTWTPWESRPAKPDTLSPACRAYADRTATPQEPAMRAYGPSDHWSRNPGRTLRQSKLASVKSRDYLDALRGQAAALLTQTWAWQAEHGATAEFRAAAADLLGKVQAGTPIYLPIPEDATQNWVSDQIDEIKPSIEKLRTDLAAMQATTAKPAQADRESRGPAAEGFYVVDEGPDAGIYKVQLAVHGSGRPYAKKLVTEGPGAGSWEYAKGMQYKLTPEQTLTREKAAKYGELYGMCVRCGATLTAEDSIERYMGPVCYEKTGF